jgi:hypothetical protein
MEHCPLKKAGTIDQLLRTLPYAEHSQEDRKITEPPTEKEGVMVPQRFQISLRIEPALRTELEEMAKRENHTLGNVATLLLEWGYKQLKVAGTTERLLQCGIPFDSETRSDRERWARPSLAFLAGSMVVGVASTNRPPRSHNSHRKKAG